MNALRALLVGALLWAVIFIEWSILLFAPVVKDMGDRQNFVHYVLLIPIVLFGAWLFYKNGNKTNGFLAGVLMLIAGIVLDALITVPLFAGPQNGVTHVEFFTSGWMLIGFVELILISGLYWMKKVK
jgi:hypothetical protein